MGDVVRGALRRRAARAGAREAGQLRVPDRARAGPPAMRRTMREPGTGPGSRGHSPSSRCWARAAAAAGAARPAALRRRLPPPGPACPAAPRSSTPRVLHEARLDLDPAAWRALRDNYLDNQYYAANLAVDGVAVPQVGVRSRGEGSRNEEKPGLKVEFDKYVPAQEYYGYKSLVLDNLVHGREHAARAAVLPRVRGHGDRRAPQRASRASP
ncbi:MAG: hypothetical protein M0C28_36985 [Candidatus Moduliflexus flocculans]|nr:hypothetical protein [Candidatus Moduliflexus flocculans]